MVEVIRLRFVSVEVSANNLSQLLKQEMQHTCDNDLYSQLQALHTESSNHFRSLLTDELPIYCIRETTYSKHDNASAASDEHIACYETFEQGQSTAKTTLTQSIHANTKRNTFRSPVHIKHLCNRWFADCIHELTLQISISPQS